MSRLISCCALLALTTLSTTNAQESSREDFVAYAKTQTGRWVGEVTWITDWPGLGQKGEKVTAYWEGTMTEDGNAVIGRFFGGGGSATSMIYFDPGSKQVVEQVVTSGGTVWRGIITRRGDRFISVQTGSNPNGDRIESTNTLTILDGGNKATWTGAGKVGDEPTTLNDTWRRVGKAPASR